MLVLQLSNKPLKKYRQIFLRHVNNQFTDNLQSINLQSIHETRFRFLLLILGRRMYILTTLNNNEHNKAEITRKDGT